MKNGRRIDKKIPVLSKFSCIAGDVNLAATISSYFNQDEEYFPVFEYPRIGRPDASNEIIKRNNALALARPEKIFLAGLSKDILDALRVYLPENRIVVIQSTQELEDKINTYLNINFKDELKCLPNEIAQGLILAKKRKSKLTVDPTAKSIIPEYNNVNFSDHLIVLDDLRELAPVISANYSFSLDAKLVVAPELKEEDIDSFYESVFNTRVLKDKARVVGAKREITEQIKRSRMQIKELDNNRIKFATFITRGMPYGYFFPEIPTAHLFSYPDLSLSVFHGIFNETYNKEVRTALLLDPGFFENSEIPAVSKSLREMGVYVKELVKDEVKMHDTGMYLQYYPYNLLFICSHAGEIPGDLITARFDGPDGKEHEIVIEEGLSYGLTGEGKGMQAMVDAQHFIGFVSIDGVDWKDKGTKKKMGAGKIVKTFLSLPRNKWRIVKSIHIDRVSRCQVIQTSDGFLQPMFHTLAGQENPIIFNNACVSFYEFAGRLFFAGARGYVGTLTPVDTNDAQDVAEDVFTNLDKNKPLSVLLWEAQRKVYDEPRDRVYVYCGCHFTSLGKPTVKTEEYIGRRIALQIGFICQKLGLKKLPEDVHRNLRMGVKFLAQLL